MNIQEKLNSLKPYISGIWFDEGIQTVEAKFKSNWTLIEDENIEVAKGESENGTRLFLLGKDENVTIDYILKYAESVINHNIEQEKKNELFKEKVKEFKEVFKEHSLEELKKLEFKIPGSENNGSEQDDNEIKIDLEEDTEAATNGSENKTEETADKKEEKNTSDDKKKEKVTEQNKKEDQKGSHEHKTTKVQGGKVELPNSNDELAEALNKGDIAVEDYNSNNNGEKECNCGPNEACPVCVDQKSL